MSQTVEYLKNRSFLNYYDIACGGGWFTSIVLKSGKGVAKVTGIEISPQYKDEYYKNLANYHNVEYIEQDINKYKWGNGLIDCISISLSLHHIHNIERIVERIYQHLDEDGLCIIYEMINDNLTPSQMNQLRFHHLKGTIDRDNGEFHRRILGNIFAHFEELWRTQNQGINPNFTPFGHHFPAIRGFLEHVSENPHRDVFSYQEIQSIITSVGFTVVHEELETNAEECNRDPIVIENIKKQIHRKNLIAYGENIPKRVADETTSLLEDIRENGFAPPPLLLCIGKK